ncbi:Hint domain-containing protein [Ruegeria sp. ANG-R]|uniref:Hint domain-containing protein n=1 Tax=Ruegeria sp. ANG-R TaxID=1577903 RepID=UPI00068A6A5F|nr:Hint domain-containing protein [Ruegeria sp. ANG-R]
MGTFTYKNSFDDDGDGDNLNGASEFGTSGTGLGVFNSPNSGDGDNEFVFYSGAGEENKLDLNANLTGTDRVNSFTAEMTLDFTTRPGPWGDGESDGLTFNLGDPSSLSSIEERGVSTGLAIRLAPFSWGTTGYAGNVIEIRWNNTIIGSTTVSDLSSPAASTFSVSVDTSGNVSVSFGSETASGSIPGTEWTSTSQDGWDFLIAGRTGANAGEAYIDDIDVTANTVCFAAGTLIDTPIGPVPVETLRPADMVLTADNGSQPIRWINTRKFCKAQLEAATNLKPVIIRANALGKGYPASDLTVSRQHRIMVRSRIAERMFGCPEVLVPAVKLLDLPGVFVDAEADGVTYVHFLCDNHEVVFANGQPSETLLLGDQACETLGADALEEIRAIFPDIDISDRLPISAKAIPDRARLGQFVARHRKNKKPFLSAVEPEPA